LNPPALFGMVRAGFWKRSLVRHTPRGEDRPLSCLHGSPLSFGLDKGSSFGWGLLHVGFNVGFIWPCTTRREFVV
jgi:hypothetical protein